MHLLSPNINIPCWNHCDQTYFDDCIHWIMYIFVHNCEILVEDITSWNEGPQVNLSFCTHNIQNWFNWILEDWAKDIQYWGCCLSRLNLMIAFITMRLLLWPIQDWRVILLVLGCYWFIFFNLYNTDANHERVSEEEEDKTESPQLE